MYAKFWIVFAMLVVVAYATAEISANNPEIVDESASLEPRAKRFFIVSKLIRNAKPLLIGGAVGYGLGYAKARG